MEDFKLLVRSVGPQLLARCMAVIINPVCCSNTAAWLHLLTHVLFDASLMHNTKAMPHHALELPFILSLPISSAPFALQRLPFLPAAFIV